MANYTLELRQISESRNLKVFDFDYSFYSENHRKEFEEKFINYYFFHEIGVETIQRFKHNLKTKLNEIMPYYSQLYESEMKAKDINFLLNKDLKESFIREQNNTNNMTGDSLNKVNGVDNTDYKESNVGNGNASLSWDSLTSINQNNNNFNNTNTSNSNVVNNGNEREETTLVSQGNIGITSSAELLQKWRDVMINIDQMILKECRDLFMTIY